MARNQAEREAWERTAGQLVVYDSPADPSFGVSYNIDWMSHAEEARPRGGQSTRRISLLRIVKRASR